MQRGVAFTERELFREPLSPAALDDDAALDLMAEEPYLIRRPLVRRGSRLVVGGAPDAVRALLD